MRRALPGSWEELFHEAELRRVLIDTSRTPGRRLERAIGVVYRPETERISHYFHARLADALTSRETERADAAMRAHVRYGLAEISGQIQTMSTSEWRESRKASRR